MNEVRRHTQQWVAALDDIDYYHRRRWIDSIQQKRDAAMHYFESLLVKSASGPEMSTGTTARNIRLMTICGVVSYAQPHDSGIVAIFCEKKREHLK